MKESLLPSLTLLHAGWAKDDERWNFGPISSVFMRLYAVTRGSAEVTMNGNKHQLTEGHLYLIPPLTTHYDHSNGLFEHYYLHGIGNTHAWSTLFELYDFPFELPVDELSVPMIHNIVDQHPELRLSHPHPDTYETMSGLQAASNRFAEYDIGTQYELSAKLELVFSLFLKHARRRSIVTDNRIKRAIKEVEQQLHRPIDLAELSTLVALSKEQFIRLFHKQVGTTPTAYIITRKLQRAQVLLASGEHSVKQVAMNLGYDNVSYFCRIFRQRIGMTATEFKRQNS